MKRGEERERLAMVLLKVRDEAKSLKRIGGGLMGIGDSPLRELIALISKPSVLTLLRAPSKLSKRDREDLKLGRKVRGMRRGHSLSRALDIATVGHEWWFNWRTGIRGGHTPLAALLSSKGKRRCEK